MNIGELITFFYHFKSIIPMQSGLFVILQKIRYTDQKSNEKRVASWFNPIELFSPNENKISNVLAFLLSPSGKHGQKEAFLKLFLKLFLQKELEQSNEIEVLREFRTDENRRIDVTIKISGYWIGIENKINADDQEKQLEDYARYLGYGDRVFALFYLTPYGRAPSECSIEPDVRESLENDGKLLYISYSDIINFLQQAEMICCADNVRFFIRSFIKYINHNILGESDMEAKDMVAEQLESNRTDIEYVKILCEAYETYKEKWIADIKREIKNRLMFEEWMSKKNGGYMWYSSELSSLKSKNEQIYEVRIEIENKSHDIYVGIRVPEKGPAPKYPSFNEKENSFFLSILEYLEYGVIARKKSDLNFWPYQYTVENQFSKAPSEVAKIIVDVFKEIKDKYCEKATKQ